jgi:hypothetical protein
MEKYTAIKDRAQKYTSILKQVLDYREVWDLSLKAFINSVAETILTQTGVSAQIEVEERFENLESITISLGKTVSGIAENVDDITKRNIIKDKGSLIYSQLFNGKIQAWMTYPVIEGLMQAKQPKMLGIYGPPEFNEDLILDNFDEFFKELIEWENYDDDQPGQSTTVNRIGFGLSRQKEEESQ